MKVKYQQLYSNDCGICAIKNLLNLYKIKRAITAIVSEKGISMNQIIEELKNDFFDVKAVSFEIETIKKVKKFTPFIALLKNDKSSHYVVIYKKTNRHLYVLDSLTNKSYKITYGDFKKIDSKKYIVAENVKKATYKVVSFQNICLIPLMSIIETILILSTTILLQQIIDNGYKDAILYVIVQVVLLLITTYKTRLFLKTFKTIDNEVIINTTKGIYNLKKDYINNYDLDEIYYRTLDAYSYKSMILNFIFDVINDVILTLFTIVLMFKYSIVLTLLILLLSSIAILFSINIFKKSKVLVEKRRVSEYNFINTYRDSLKNKENIYEYKDKSYENQTISKLILFQKDDYECQKINMKKNVILTYFQSFIMTLLIVLYFTKFYDLLSIGSLIALINLASLLLQPILSLCSQAINFSNYSLIYKRLKDIEKNID